MIWEKPYLRNGILQFGGKRKTRDSAFSFVTLLLIALKTFNAYYEIRKEN